MTNKILCVFTVMAKVLQSVVVITVVIGVTIMLLLAFGVAAKPGGGVVQPKICKPLVKAKAVSKTYAGLTDKAINKWKVNANSLYGSRFANFNQAQIVSIPIGFSNGKHWVIVKAKPCKPIGFGIKHEVQGLPKPFVRSLTR